jgi:hypothetical protein
MHAVYVLHDGAHMFEPYPSFTNKGVKKVVNEGKSMFILLDDGDVYSVRTCFHFFLTMHR